MGAPQMANCRRLCSRGRNILGGWISSNGTWQQFNPYAALLKLLCVLYSLLQGRISTLQAALSRAEQESERLSGLLAAAEAAAAAAKNRKWLCTCSWARSMVSVLGRLRHCMRR